LFRKKPIDEWALDYYLLQRYAKLAIHIYYKKIKIVGMENIPRNQPVILAPNHQNALMDAMVLVTMSGRIQSVFLARADIFKGKLLTRILTFLNIMPIYRIRDGIDNVKRNDEVFAKTLQVLRNRLNPLVMFPEGNHGDRRRLRPLVKGLFRIAFMGQEDYGDRPGVKVIPVGIDYGHYQHFGSTLFVNIGMPMDMAPYHALHKENPVAGINKLKEDFAVALDKQMINIRTEDHYELYMNLRTIFNSEMRRRMGISGNSLPERFRADKAMIGLLDRELDSNPENIEKLDAMVSDYLERLNELRLRDWVIERGKQPFWKIASKTLLQWVLFPVFAFGLVHNYIPYAFTASRVKGIKDQQFHSSFKWVIGMIVFPVMYIIVAVILAFLGWPFWIKILYILVMPVAGVSAFRYYIRSRKLGAVIRFSRLFRKGDERVTGLLAARKAILDQVNGILDTHAQSSSA
jgi:1-acyl-sn-glycerol-3-phosphate acyltransferase